MRFIITTILVFFCLHSFGQSYIKLEIDRGDTLNNCDNVIRSMPIGMADGPKQITWWDSNWQPSTGFTAENICINKHINHGIVDTNCTHLESMILVLGDTFPQIYLDTVIAVMPSHPDSCDGSLSFVVGNIQVGDTKTFGSSSSGGVTNSTVFTGLCPDYYNFGVHLNGGAILKVRVSLNFPPITPCKPHKDSLVIAEQSAPGNCDASVTYNSEFLDGTTTLFHHMIIQPVGSGSVVINSDSLLSYTGLCAGPYIVRTEDQISSNQYFVSNTIFVDEPLLNDSVWGNPSSPQVDTILLNALTNCGINYSFNVDSVYISNMTYLGGSQFEFEITVLQGNDTLKSYETTIADTSKQLCFDLTFFCADSTGFGTIRSSTGLNQLHSYIYFDASEDTPSNIEEADHLNNINVYPNPAKNELIVTDLAHGEHVISLYAMDGRLLFRQASLTHQLSIDLSGFSSGLYLLNVTSNKTRSKVYRKIMISK